MTDIDADAYNEQFREQGYLAPLMGEIIKVIRASNNDLFQIAETANAIAQAMYIDGTLLLKGRDTKEPLCLALQMAPRALGAYQGALLLAERGMYIEALTLARTIFEVGFWVGYIHENPSEAVPQLFADTLKGEISLLKAMIEAVAATDPDLVAECEKRLADTTAERAKYPAHVLTLKDVAARSGFSQSYAQYKELCGAAAHNSLKSILPYLSRGEGTFSGHIIGPDEQQVPRALAYALSGLITVIEGIRRVTNNAEHDARFEALLRRYADALDVLEKR